MYWPEPDQTRTFLWPMKKIYCQIFKSMITSKDPDLNPDLWILIQETIIYGFTGSGSKTMNVPMTLQKRGTVQFIDLTIMPAKNKVKRLRTI